MKFYVYIGTKLEEAFLKGDDEEDIESFWFSESEIDGMIKKGEIINVHLLAAWACYKVRNI